MVSGKKNINRDIDHRAIVNKMRQYDLTKVSGVSKNAPTLQCHIFKNIQFDVFKFSTGF